MNEKNKYFFRSIARTEDRTMSDRAPRSPVIAPCLIVLELGLEGVSQEWSCCLFPPRAFCGRISWNVHHQRESILLLKFGRREMPKLHRWGCAKGFDCGWQVGMQADAARELLQKGPDQSVTQIMGCYERQSSDRCQERQNPRPAFGR